MSRIEPYEILDFLWYVGFANSENDVELDFKEVKETFSIQTQAAF